MPRHRSTAATGLFGLALLASLVPGTAQANRLKVASYALFPEAGVIELQGDAPLDEPFLKLEGSSLKVWFPKIDGLSRFEQGDSDQPIASVRLRAGSGQTALLALELNTPRPVTRDEVVVTRNGTRASVRIAWPATPSSPPAASSASAPAGPSAHAAQKLAAPGPTANAAAPALPASATNPAQGAAAPNAPNAPSAPQYKGAAVADSGAAAKARPAAREPQWIEAQGGLSTTQVLIAVSIVLGGIYLALRAGLRQRGAAAAGPSIQLLGSRRLGARHQLLIVRALGQDHLLSVHGGRTDRIMSADVPAGTPASNTALDVATAQAPDEADASDGVDPVGAGMAATLRSLRSRELFKRNAGKPAHDDTTPFGAELRDLVRAPERRGELAESEAIAGLVRLRGRSS